MDSISSKIQQRNTNNSTSLVFLSNDLYVDLESGTLFCGQKEIFLTAREIKVLKVLIHASRSPHCYLTADAIAQCVGIRDEFNSKHCIEQTIYMLRRKFGETLRHPCILKDRRELGYQLCIEMVKKSNPSEGY